MADPGPSPHVGGPIQSPASPDVETDNLAQARATDRLQCTGSPNPNFITTGSTTVDINNLMAARQGDMTMHPPPGSITLGSPTVEIGGPQGGALLGSDPTTGAALAACNAAAGGRGSNTTNQTYNNCGVESSRQIINQATGANVSEDALLDKSMKDGDADKERSRGDSGGTSPSGRSNILTNAGVPNSQQPNTMENIQQAVAERKGVITSHDAGKLWGTKDEGGHAILVTGIQYDGFGNPVVVYTNDTGWGTCQKVVQAAAFQASLRPGRDINVTNNPIW
jgi:uncharacterized Zn-binding protein involved in type VI secretion